MFFQLLEGRLMLARCLLMYGSIRDGVPLLSLLHPTFFLDLSPYPQLQQQGILKSDDLITRFFRISVEMCVDLCYRTLNDPVSVRGTRPLALG